MASINADRVWKRFMLQKDRAESVGQLLKGLVPGRTRQQPEPFWALRDVSFEMRGGESLGIIGNNGSGKSTLLKIVTRTMHPTHGRILVNGRLSALIELGAGFHPDFTGRENVVLNASILGITRREIARRMEEIIEFADIRPFIDVPVKYYSSGMNARLGFAVAINVAPEILIVDEVLAVGDEAFQQKCMDRIFEMKRSGVSILLVSHALEAIERLMDRAIWLRDGNMEMDGKPREVVHAYRKYLGGAAVSEDGGRLDALAGGDVQLKEVVVRGVHGDGIFARDAVDIICSWDCAIVVNGAMSLMIRRPDGLVVAEVSTRQDQVGLELPLGPSRTVLSVSQIMLATGRYQVDVTLFGKSGERIGQWARAAEFTVQDTGKTSGLILLPHSWKTANE